MLDSAKLIEDHNLQFKCMAVTKNPYMPHETEDLSHWLCSISGEVVAGFEFYVSLGSDYDNEPDADLALSLVLSDIRSYRECTGYDDFIKLIGIEENDPAGRLAWEEISRLAPVLESLIESSPTHSIASV